jgi:hypothetical protein
MGHASNTPVNCFVEYASTVSSLSVRELSYLGVITSGNTMLDAFAWSFIYVDLQPSFSPFVFLSDQKQHIKVLKFVSLPSPRSRFAVYSLERRFMNYVVL